MTNVVEGDEEERLPPFTWSVLFWIAILAFAGCFAKHLNWPNAKRESAQVDSRVHFEWRWWRAGGHNEERIEWLAGRAGLVVGDEDGNR